MAHMPLTRRAVIRTGAAALAGVAGGVLGHGYVFERHALRLLEADLPVRGLAAEHDGVRVGLITDVHHGAFTGQPHIARAVDLVMSARPDVVVLGGDYVSLEDRRYMEPCAEALAPLNAPHGVFAVLGNHDDDRYMPAALARRGFAVLRDQCTTITLKGAPLALAGVRYSTRQSSAIRRIVSGSKHTTILLAHDPRRLVEAATLGLAAVLSGHTHGGQIVLPFLGSTLGKHFPVVAGLGSQGGTGIFVSRGVGTVYIPARLNCPPDVAMLTLRAAATVSPQTGTDSPSRRRAGRE